MVNLGGSSIVILLYGIALAWTWHQTGITATVLQEENETTNKIDSGVQGESGISSRKVDSGMKSCKPACTSKQTCDNGVCRTNRAKDEQGGLLLLGYQHQGPRGNATLWHEWARRVRDRIRNLIDKILIRPKRGDKGETGEKGEQGEEGEKGVVGDKGKKGDIGPMGIKGDAGYEGDDGDKGSLGPVGPQGDKGAKGDAGTPGAKGGDGPKGADGPQGLKGDQGIKGDIGPAGPDGQKGPKGEKGDPGPKGEKGDKGDKGDTGPKGDTGDKGGTGSSGSRGDKGYSGTDGEKGPRGARGLEFLRSVPITNYGEWGPQTMCSPGDKIIGFSIQVEPKTADDTGLNGISLRCQKAHDQEAHYDIYVKGPNGKFGDTYNCPQYEYATGFQMRQQSEAQSKTEAGNENDMVGAASFRLICGGAATNAFEPPEGLPYGSWTEPQLCQKGYFVCGIQSQVDKSAADKSGLNNVIVTCCSGCDMNELD